MAVLPGVTYVDLYDYLTDAQGQLNDTLHNGWFTLESTRLSSPSRTNQEGDFRMKVGLVLEGGGMRGLYTAGVFRCFF